MSMLDRLGLGGGKAVEAADREALELRQAEEDAQRKARMEEAAMREAERAKKEAARLWDDVTRVTKKIEDNRGKVDVTAWEDHKAGLLNRLQELQNNEDALVAQAAREGVASAAAAAQAAPQKAQQAAPQQAQQAAPQQAQQAAPATAVKPKAAASVDGLARVYAIEAQLGQQGKILGKPCTQEQIINLIEAMFEAIQIMRKERSGMRAKGGKLIARQGKGAPRKPIDWQRYESLKAAKLTKKDIAKYLDVSESTLRKAEKARGCK